MITRPPRVPILIPLKIYCGVPMLSAGRERDGAFRFARGDVFQYMSDGGGMRPENAIGPPVRTEEYPGIENPGTGIRDILFQSPGGALPSTHFPKRHLSLIINSHSPYIR